jgi:hypothetical protein
VKHSQYIFRQPEREHLHVSLATEAVFCLRTFSPGSADIEVCFSIVFFPRPLVRFEEVADSGTSGSPLSSAAALSESARIESWSSSSLILTRLSSSFAFAFASRFRPAFDFLER